MNWVKCCNAIMKSVKSNTGPQTDSSKFHIRPIRRVLNVENGLEVWIFESWASHMIRRRVFGYM